MHYRLLAFVTAAASCLAPVSAQAATSSAVLLPTDDAMVQEASAGANFGAEPTLRVDAATGADVSSLLTFDPSDLAGHVQSAQLRVYAESGSADGLRVRTTGGGWSEASVTWATRPAATSASIASTASVGAGSWIVLDVTAAFSGTSGVSLLLEARGADGIDLISKEGSFAPRVVVTVDDSAPAPDPDPVSAPAPTGCPTWGTGQLIGTAATPTFASGKRELSGLVASRRNPGVYYTQHDGWQNLTQTQWLTEELYAIDAQGRHLATIKPSNDKLVQWEDLTIGQGPGTQPYIYIGGLGNNGRTRDAVEIHRIMEPAIALSDRGRLIGPSTVSMETMWIRYPNGNQDAETLIADPRNGDLHIVSKVNSGNSNVYRIPYPFTMGNAKSNPVTVQHSGPISFPYSGPDGDPVEDLTHQWRMTTGGAISADGSTVVIRTYRRAHAWRRGLSQSFYDAVRQQTTCLTDVEHGGGEAVALAANGDMYTVTESGKFHRHVRTNP